MSAVQQIIQAVTQCERQIDDQLRKLNAFSQQIEQVVSQVQAQLAGSTQSYDQKMMQQLNQTKKQLQDTIQLLQNAKSKLARVRVI